MDDSHLLMITTRNQCTIAGPAVVEGFGYWSGRDVRVEFRPARAGSGVVFVRGDLPGCPRIKAHVANRVEIPRRTCLRCGEASVEMVEHIMASLCGLGIDNCEVWVNQPEMPGCDGSAEPFVRALDSVGTVRQGEPRPVRVVRQFLRLGDERAWVEARPPLAEATVLKYHLDYGPEAPIGRQSCELSLTPDVFRRELAPCRTFMLQAEADWLLSQGLGLRASCRDLLVFGENGPIENQLRFPDECVRHKLLDLMGDLALAGCQLVGRFSAYRSGHRLNAELVQQLLDQAEEVDQWKRCA
jgi:UDP-3-O-acyl N-acetylglucosamine deacetylase